MALAVTASFVDSCRLDVSWSSIDFCMDEPQRYQFAVCDTYDGQEWIVSRAARLEYRSKLSKVQLNLTEIRNSSSSRYTISMKGIASSSYTEIENILPCKVVRSGSCEVGFSSAAVSATSDAMDTTTGPVSSTASNNSG